MKTAVVISGKPTDWTKHFRSIEKNILSRYNPDIFIHTWAKNYTISSVVNPNLKFNAKGAFIDELIAAYQPKLITIEKFDTEKDTLLRKELDNYNSNSPQLRIAYDKTFASETLPSRVYWQYYGIYSASVLQRQYIITNNVHYDLVFRLRFDVSYENFPDIMPEKNTLHIPDGEQCRGGISPDLLVCGEQTVMNKYFDLFLEILHLKAKKESLHPESMLRYYIERQNISVQRFPLIYTFKGNIHDTLSNKYQQ